MSEELWRLRRFALAIALILITYVIAGIKMKVDAEITSLGIPFVIARTDWLPIGLAIASAFSALRFWYYGCLRTDSPGRRRAEGYRALEAAQEKDEAVRPDFIARVESSYPRGFRGRRAKVTAAEGIGSGAAILGFPIPWDVRFLSVVEQVDYVSPIWLNVAALFLYGISFTRFL